MGPSAPLGTQGIPHGPGHPSEPNTPHGAQGTPHGAAHPLEPRAPTWPRAPLVAQDPFSLCCAPHSAPWPRAHLEPLLRDVHPTPAWCSCLQKPPLHPFHRAVCPLIKTKRHNLFILFILFVLDTCSQGPGQASARLFVRCLVTSAQWPPGHSLSLRRPVIFHLWLYRRWDSQEHDADGARGQLQVRETWPRREHCAGCWPSLEVSFTILPPSLRPGPAGQGPLPSVRCLFSVLSSWLPKPDPLTIGRGVLWKVLCLV